MRIDDVAIIGGGPAGLFAAILLRRAHPDARVVVYERSVPDETFGFGIAFTRTTLDMIAAADQESFEQLRASSVDIPAQELRIGSESAWSHGNAGAIGIARATLLKVLTERAVAVGADVRFGEAATLDQLHAVQLVIAADGVSSSVRGALGDSIGAHVTPGRGVFMWLGCDTQLRSNLFAPVLTPDGLFNIHCYPYGSQRSTIGVEAEVDTWRNAGMDLWTDETPVGESDARSIAYLQDVFGPVLGGAKLVGNRSRWMHFRTVTVDHWHRGNVVLIGDAAHTAHYSVGAGTKMAMDDAVALVAALGSDQREAGSAASLEDALASYERDRRPRVEHLQDLADRSRWWWESLSARVDLPVAQLMSAYMSRGGAVSSRKLLAFERELVVDAIASWSGEELTGGELDAESLSGFVLSRPLNLGTAVLESRVLDRDTTSLRLAGARVDIRDPWSSEADQASDEVAAAAVGAEAVILSGADGRTALLDRLQFAERARLGSVSAIGVQADRENEDDIVDALLAERIDFVEWIVG